jgi:hypothetical protein
MALERFAPIIIPVFDGSKERRDGPRTVTTARFTENETSRNSFNIQIKNNTNDDHVTHQKNKISRSCSKYVQSCT